MHLKALTAPFTCRLHFCDTGPDNGRRIEKIDRIFATMPGWADCDTDESQGQTDEACLREAAPAGMADAQPLAS